MAQPRCRPQFDTRTARAARRLRASLRHGLACIAALLVPLVHGEPAAPPAAGAAFTLALPIDCRIGTDCWVASYVDTDPGAGAADFRCGPRSYEGHDGVDIAIRDLGVMAAGVRVLAAAPGVVRNVRDGMDDVAIGEAASIGALAGRDCGNGVLLEHAGGWQTQYCHLRRGSVRVRPGEAVAAGAPLALVGLSGRTEFPHLHLAVRANGSAIDPFSGRAPGAGCTGENRPLWRPEAGMRYEDVALYNVGFAPGPPDIDAIRRGERSDGPWPADAPALVLWADVLGVRTGDRLQFRVTAPDGSVVFDTPGKPVERNQARRYEFAGARLRQRSWMPGIYRGEVLLERLAGETRSVRRASAQLEIEPP